MTTHNREPKPCKHCGKDFLATNPNQKYCTQQCSKDGRRACKRAYRREYTQKNKEHIRESNHKYYLKNKEHIKQRSHERYSKNRKRINQQATERHRNNPEVQREADRRRYAANLDKERKSRAQKAAARAEGNATPQLIEAKWEASNKTCALCGKPIDTTTPPCDRSATRVTTHLTPIARGGRHDLDNIDFAHYGCNASKRDKTLEEYREWRERVA